MIAAGLSDCVLVRGCPGARVVGRRLSAGVLAVLLLACAGPRRRVRRGLWMMIRERIVWDADCEGGGMTRLLLVAAVLVVVLAAAGVVSGAEWDV